MYDQHDYKLFKHEVSDRSQKRSSLRELDYSDKSSYYEILFIYFYLEIFFNFTVKKSHLYSEFAIFSFI